MVFGFQPSLVGGLGGIADQQVNLDWPEQRLSMTLQDAPHALAVLA
ncbi:MULTISPECIES: hypothetical protein [unclassified Mesorhizobium]